MGKKLVFIFVLMAVLISAAMAEEAAIPAAGVLNASGRSNVLPVDLRDEVEEIAELFLPECEHTEYEFAQSYDSVSFDTYQYNETHHRYAKKMVAVCLQCSVKKWVYLDSTFVAHNWVSNGDAHLLGPVHRYYQRCSECMATSYYDRTCLSYPEISSVGVGSMIVMNIWHIN